MIRIIAAMTKTGVIGKNNQLPWNIPDEMQHFKKTTLNSTVIMGYKTFESIGRPLPQRNNIVLTADELLLPGVHVCNSVDQAIESAIAYNKDIFVIGGAYTYKQFLPMTDYLYISFIKNNYDGDVFFPTINWFEWQVIEEVEYPTFIFVLYKRIR